MGVADRADVADGAPELPERGRVEVARRLHRDDAASREHTAVGRTLPEPARHAATNHSLMKLVPTIPISMLVLP